MVFLDSTKVSVFPSANRSQYPSSRLTTEENLTNIIKKLSGNGTFVISDTYNSEEPFEFMIDGYYFRVETAGSIIDSFQNDDNIYAQIKTVEWKSGTVLFKELYPQDSTLATVYTINLTNNVVTWGTDGSAIIDDNKFTINDVEYTIVFTGDDPTSVTWNDGENSTSVNSSMKFMLPPSDLDQGYSFKGVNFTTELSQDDTSVKSLHILTKSGGNGVIPEDSRLILQTYSNGDSNVRQVRIDDGYIGTQNN